MKCSMSDSLSSVFLSRIPTEILMIRYLFTISGNVGLANIASCKIRIFNKQGTMVDVKSHTMIGDATITNYG